MCSRFGCQVVRMGVSATVSTTTRVPFRVETVMQSAVKKLLEKDIITEINKEFSLTDKLFAMWISNLYGKSYVL